jgi:hypothetical protein
VFWGSKEVKFSTGGKLDSRSKRNLVEARYAAGLGAGIEKKSKRNAIARLSVSPELRYSCEGAFAPASNWACWTCAFDF